MHKTDPEVLAVAIVMTVIGFSILAAATVMILPAHSGQARPQLAHLTIPQVPDALDRQHLAKTATYRDLKHPTLQECADPTPHSEEEPRDFYVTVAEGDRENMLALLSYTAGINDSLVRPLFYGLTISYHDGWEPWLDTLDPAIHRNKDRLHPGYTEWANRAAVVPIPPDHRLQCAALPHAVRIYVDEQNVGHMSDSDTKQGSILLFIVAPFIIGISATIYIAARWPA